MKVSDVLLFALGFTIGNPETRKLLMKVGNEMGALAEKEFNKAKASFQEADKKEEKPKDAQIL
jgi:hypothetical protein